MLDLNTDNSVNINASVFEVSYSETVLFVFLGKLETTKDALPTIGFLN